MPRTNENPRDHNRQADYAQGTAERLALDYAELMANVERALETAAELPATLVDSEDVAVTFRACGADAGYPGAGAGRPQGGERTLSSWWRNR